MVRKRALSPKPIFDENLLLPFLAERGIKAIHAKNIWKHLLKTKATSLAEIEGVHALPDGLAEEILREFTLSTSTVKEVFTSTDGTTKLLVELQDGLTVETVIIPGGATTGDKPGGNPRTTLCVSSQVGCKMGCTFCATGTMGEIGNLNAGEICEQLWHANKFQSVRNVVFMGMGEPLNNYESVLAAIRAMTDTHRFKLSPNHVTLSTVGIIPGIMQVAKDLPHINLALSLHAPSQEVRQTFVPAAKPYPLDKLMNCIDEYLEITKRKVLMEYVVLKGENDSAAQAAELAELLNGKDVTVNLIPYNPTYNPRLDNPHEAPEMEVVQKMQNILYKKGIRSTIRKEKGQDIAGACGQLVVQTGGPKGSQKPSSPVKKTTDIEDLMGGGSRVSTCKRLNAKQSKQLILAGNDAKSSIPTDSIKGASSVNFYAFLAAAVAVAAICATLADHFAS